jgi:DNA-binding transcriptional LysR family regulator
MPHSTVRQLDIFAQMAAAGSMARGAADLGLSAQAVESGIASLEMRLGYRLFDRDGDAVRLTPAGRKTAQAMALLSIDEPGEAAAASAPAAAIVAPPPPAPPRAAIILAAPAAVFGHFQDALSAFEDANEDVAITLDLYDHLAGDAADALDRGAVDIVYFYAFGAPAGFDSRYGWSEQINLYAGEGHPLARTDLVSRSDLAGVPLLAMEPGNPLRRLTDEGLAKAGLPPAPAGLETDNMFAILSALRDGAGCFAAFGPLARDLGRMAGVRRVALDIPLPSVEVRQAVSARAAGAAAIGALADYLFL